MGTDAHIAQLLSIISSRNMFQAKALKGLEDRMLPDEKEGLGTLLDYYVEQGDSVDYLAECYLRFVEDIMEEQFYFVRNGRYRYSSGEEVNAFFYQNPEYMEYYMKGLAVSTYLITPHRQCRAWFREKVSAQTYRGGGIS